MRVRYLVELYLPTPDLGTAAAAARDAAGSSVRIVEALSVPEDETCFLVLEACAEEDVVSLMARAGLSINRISAVVTEPQVTEGGTA